MNSFTHIGGKIVLQNSAVIGVFDLDTVSVGKGTKIFLKKMQEEDMVETATEELPRSMALTAPPVTVRKGKLKEGRLYLSPITSLTIQKRSLDPENTF